MSKEYKVGTILKTPQGLFTKVISCKNSVYGLSDFSNRVNAEKATRADRYINIYGLEYANVQVVGITKTEVAKKPNTQEEDENLEEDKTLTDGEGDESSTEDEEESEEDTDTQDVEVEDDTTPKTEVAKKPNKGKKK